MGEVLPDGLFRLGDMVVGHVLTSSLVRRRENYRKMADAQRATLEKSVERFGFRSFIVVTYGKVKGTYEVIDGHHRWETAISRKMERVPVIVLDKGGEEFGFDLAMFSFNVSAEVVPEVQLAFLRDLSMQVGGDVVSQFTSIDAGFLKDLSTPVSAAPLAPLAEQKPTANHKPGVATVVALPGTAEVRALLDTAKAISNTPTDAQAVVEALKAFTSKGS